MVKAEIGNAVEKTKEGAAKAYHKGKELGEKVVEKGKDKWHDSKV